MSNLAVQLPIGWTTALLNTTMTLAGDSPLGGSSVSLRSSTSVLTSQVAILTEAIMMLKSLRDLFLNLPDITYPKKTARKSKIGLGKLARYVGLIESKNNEWSGSQST